jgi:hypothetical protein
MDMVGEMASGDFSSLPSRKIIPLVELLKEPIDKSFIADKQNIIEEIILK